MAMLKYMKREKTAFPDKKTCKSLTEIDLRQANEEVKKCLHDSSKKPTARVKYNDYTPEQRAQIGSYAAENGRTRAAVCT